jgi:hypothetical protein
VSTELSPKASGSTMGGSPVLSSPVLSSPVLGSPGASSQRVALRQAVSTHGRVHEPLLAREPLVVLGAPRVPPLVSEGVRPDRRSCFGPRGAVLLGAERPLWVCDTGHHRLLGWRRLPECDETPADWLIGQGRFDEEGRNGRGLVTALTLNVPTGICRFDARGLAVADAWNHRVLIWHEAPSASHAPPDIVLGQPDFASAEANRGRSLPAADSLFWPYGVAFFEGCLFVADSENRRVLIWHGPLERHGQPADLVLGQPNFALRDENAGGAPGPASMRWPHGICFWRGHTCVSDAGNNRILVYRGLPQRSGQPADHVLGQADEHGVDHNQSAYWPRDSTLNMPYGIAASGDVLICADTANSRLLGFHADDLLTGAAARSLTGQLDFHQKGDNRWRAPVADSVCWPYGVSVCDTDAGARVVVSDSGNNRVSVWEGAA